AAAEAARGARRVGGGGLAAILSVDEYEGLRHGLDGGELVDASALFAGVKAHKDEGDLAQLRAAFRLPRLAYEAAPGLLRPGARAEDAVAELERILRSQGCGFPLVFVDSDAHFARRVSPTTLREGDLVTVLVEVASEEGFWVEQGGLFALGEPAPRARAVA